MTASKRTPDNATTQCTRPDADPPVTILDLIALMEDAIDESTAAQRLGRPYR